MSGKSSWQERRTDPKRVVLRSVLVFSIIVAVSLGLYMLGRWLETNRANPVRGDLSARQGRHQMIEYDGKTYAYNSSLQTILFMGIDRESDTEPISSFRNGGQADFLLLLIIDPQRKEITQLQIDRDTMAEITILGVLGNSAGTRTAQISLSHGFGDGRAQSCELTMEAVSRLLYGIQIDQYISLRMDSIPVLNDVVGGVTVTVEDDFSAFDPTMLPGTTLRLSGEQAEMFVQYRMQVGDGSNASRMRRQRMYLAALADNISERISSNANFVGTLYDQMGDSMITNIKRGKLINDAYKASGYATNGMVTPAGEHTVGSDGFMEFHADQVALEQMVIDIFFNEM